MKQLSFTVSVIVFLFLLFLSGCKSNNTVTTGERIENSPKVASSAELPVDSLVFLDYTPKATFTTVAQMEAKMPTGFEGGEGLLGIVNGQFLDGCYYTGDTSTPFLASFAERWNKAEFLRHFINAEEIFERENTAYDNMTETTRGVMPLLPNEYQLAFPDKKNRQMAKNLVKMLTTIDFVPEQREKMADYYQKLLNNPFLTPDFVTEEEINTAEEDFWTRYDKTVYVADYLDIQKNRMAKDADYDELLRNSVPLQEKYLSEENFDAKCIYALELARYCFPERVDYLGELIEDGRYSKYLFEIWVSWRMYAQSEVFGVSSWSEIPDNLYDNARLLVANTYVKHIAENPSDTLAKLLLMNLIYTENIHRSGGYFGNEAMDADHRLRTKLFLQDNGK